VRCCAVVEGTIRFVRQSLKGVSVSFTGAAVSSAMSANTHGTSMSANNRSCIFREVGGVQPPFVEWLTPLLPSTHSQGYFYNPRRGVFTPTLKLPPLTYKS
jgi:hypothetical protein